MFMLTVLPCVVEGWRYVEGGDVWRVECVECGGVRRVEEVECGGMWSVEVWEGWKCEGEGTGSVEKMERRVVLHVCVHELG